MISLRQRTNGMFTDKDLIRLLVPLVTEQFLAVFISMANTIMVTSCGEAAVSAVSLVEAINIFVINFLSALATGGAVVTAQYIGNKDKPNASEAVKQLYYAILIISLLVTPLFMVFRKGLLAMIFGSIDADVMSNAVIFFLLTAASFPFIAVYNAGAAAFRAMGNSKIALFCSAVMNILFLACSAILIFRFNMGVKGAGISTLAARIVGAIIITAMLCSHKSPVVINKLFVPKLKPAMIKNILSIGIPTGMDNGMFQLGRLILQRLTATFGTVVIAANAIASNISNFANLFGSAFALAMITVVGQCLGAGKKEEAKYYGKHLLKLSYVFAGISYLFFFIFSKQTVLLFGLSGEATDIATKLLQLFTIFGAIFWTPSFVLPNALRAAGDTKFTMGVSILSMWIFRIAFGYLLGAYFNMGVIGIWYAMIIDWVARAIVFYIRFRGDKWINIKVI